MQTSDSYQENNTWHVSEGGRVSGPYRPADLKKMLACRQITDQALVWDGSKWAPLLSVLNNGGGGGAGAATGSYRDLPDLEILDDEAQDGLALNAPVLEGVPKGGLFSNDTAAEPEALLPPLDGPPPERDRIVVIGRRAAGKTIFLARLYERLWRSTGELSMTALSGPAHLFLEQVADCLRKGDWPPATISSTHLEMEVCYQGRRHVMVGLDYAGELFSRAFVHEQSDIPEVRELLSHIDRAAAVIVLVDPAVMVSQLLEAVVDDDFGIVKALERIRRWPGGEEVPVVLVLTKYDQYKDLLTRHGGPKGFVRKHFPALLRTLRRVQIFAMSAVQTVRDERGQLRPRPDSMAYHVEEPLTFCMKQIIRSAQQTEAEVRRRAEDARLHQLTRALEEQERRRQVKFAVFLAGLVMVGACIILLIYFMRS